MLRILVLTSLMAAAKAQVVSIPDPGLNAAIRAALGKPAGPLTAQDMLSLTNLSADNRGVTSIEGLEVAYNLATLDLGFNLLTNFTLPPGLTSLTTLDLRNDNMTSLMFPAGMTNLTSLDLGSFADP
jgi:Leucine-rich repeat (LRR) protein